MQMALLVGGVSWRQALKHLPFFIRFIAILLMNDLNDINKLAIDMRKFFEHMLLDSIKTTKTNGSCLYAAILLSSSINNFLQAKAKVCGGGPEENAGLIDKKGVMQGHYWVEGVTSNGAKFIVDITADQFDYPPIVVLTEDEGRKRYIPGNQENIKKHVDEELELCAKAAQNYTSI